LTSSRNMLMLSCLTWDRLYASSSKPAHAPQHPRQTGCGLCLHKWTIPMRNTPAAEQNHPKMATLSCPVGLTATRLYAARCSA
jgi:hypothetical protein